MENEITKRKLVKAVQERWGDFWVRNSTDKIQAFQDVKNLYMRGVLKLRREERCDCRHSFISSIRLLLLMEDRLKRSYSNVL